MIKRILSIIAGIWLLAATGVAIFLFMQNQTLNKQIEDLSSRPVSCSECETDCSKCPSTDRGEIATSYPIKVYFSKDPESLDDPTKVYAVDRTSPSIAVATYAIQQLLAGPTASEATEGYLSNVKVLNDTSICNDKDFQINIKNGVATLQFCRTFDAIGVMSDARAQETIKATLLQFPTIKKVIILSKDGNCLFDMSGLNLCLQ